MDTSLNLATDSAKEPIERLAISIVKDAIKLDADGISLELDLELHVKVEKQSVAIVQKFGRPSFLEAIFKGRWKDYLQFGNQNFRESSVSRMFFELNQLPNALKLTYTLNGISESMTPIRGTLFEDIRQVLLSAAGVAPKTNGQISSVLSTINPASKWDLESHDLRRQIQLRRIAATI